MEPTFVNHHGYLPGLLAAASFVLSFFVSKPGGVTALAGTRAARAMLMIHAVSQPEPAHASALASTSRPGPTSQQTGENNRFFVPGMLFIVGAFLVYGIWQAHVRRLDFNTDALSYLEIARQYAAGNVVVRGYWSPLISWITAFVVAAVGIAPELAIRYVIVCFGALFTVLAAVLARQFGLRHRSQLVTAGFAAILLSSLTPVTADIIGAAFAFAYLCLIMHPSAQSQPVRYGLAAGSVAGFAYLARSYNLTFIAAHLVIYCGWLWVQKRSMKTVLRFLPGFALTLVVVFTPWIVLLSHRYERLTFSTSALHTRGLVAVGAAREQSITCLAEGRMLCPRPVDVLFPWEDHLPELQPDYDWSPFSSAENFRHQITLISDNIGYFIKLHSGMAVLGLISTGLLIGRQKQYRYPGAFLLLTAALYIGGYMLTLSSGGVRYFTVPYTLIIIAALLTLKYIQETLSRNMAALLRLSIVLLIGASTFVPAADIITVVIATLQNGEQPNACSLRDSALFAQDLTAPIANVGGSYRVSMDIAYFTRVRAVGYLDSEKLTVAEIDQQLRSGGVGTVLIADDADTGSTLQAQYGYNRVRSVSYCGTRFTIFQVPHTE